MQLCVLTPEYYLHIGWELIFNDPSALQPSLLSCMEQPPFFTEYDLWSKLQNEAKIREIPDHRSQSGLTSILLEHISFWDRKVTSFELLNRKSYRTHRLQYCLWCVKSKKMLIFWQNTLSCCSGQYLLRVKTHSLPAQTQVRPQIQLKHWSSSCDFRVGGSGPIMHSNCLYWNFWYPGERHLFQRALIN